MTNYISLLDGDLLSQALLEKSLPTPTAHYCKLALKVALFASFVVAEYFYIYVDLNLNAPRAVTWTFAVTDIIAFWLLDCWSANQLIETAFRARGPQERLLLNRGSESLCLRTTILVTALTLALFVQLPNSFPLLDYAGKWSLIAFLLTMAVEIPFPALSLVLLFHALVRRYRNQPDREREEMVAALLAQRTIFNQSDPERQKIFIETVNTSRSTRSGYIQALLTPIDSTPPATKSLGERIGELVATVAALHFLGWSWFYTRIETKKYLSTQEAVAELVAAISTLVIAYLATLLILDAGRRVARALTCKAHPPSFAERIHPHWMKAACCLVAICALTSNVSTWVISGELFPNQPKMALYSRVTMSTACWLYLYGPGIDFSTEAIEAWIWRTGTPQQQEVLALRAELERARTLIEECSLEDFQGQILSHVRYNIYPFHLNGTQED